MGLLNVALLVVVLLAATMEAKPIRHRHDADIPDKNQPQRYLAELSEGSEESSEESSEEETEEEEEEDEEDEVVDVTDAVTIPPLVVVTTDSQTFTSGDGSTLAPEPEPDTANTAGPVIMVRETTPEPEATAVTAAVTTAEVVLTSLRATDMRGDI
ncbi:bone sialoprotein 2-like [Xiphophorus couchianus]|uniref:bone sialoprotein 2-like n=1 Tax=Xiphophorus couchianus TaxID=32473 RepID=UPI0010168806|nr:bone sialoprotein 2-like [Xiphophorus couchianus]